MTDDYPSLGSSNTPNTAFPLESLEQDTDGHNTIKTNLDVSTFLS